jgi:hypothetical protein
MLDLHPVTEEHLEDADGRPIGVIPETEWLTVDLPNAEACVRDAVRDGLLALEAETEFDMLQHFDEHHELIEAKADLLEGQHALVQAVHAAKPPLVSREHYVLRRLCKR